jgi:GT2 family glycosyltransferase
MNAQCAAIQSLAPKHAAGEASCDSRSGSEAGFPQLSIICVNWNSLDYLIECVTSIYENAPSVPFEVIVVDNASPEGGQERFAVRFPQVRLLKSEENLGFAGANNLGFRHSFGRYVLFLNPDTRVISSAIDRMLEQLSSTSDAGIVGCTLLNTDLTISTTSIQKFPTILNQLLTAEALRVRFPSLPLWNIAPLFTEQKRPLKVDVIPGACMMLRRDVFEQAGQLTEEYFMYAEDIDLNYKVSKLGLSSYYVGSAQVVHHGGRSSSRQKVSHWSTVMIHRAMDKYFHISRGRLYAVGYRIAMAAAAVMRIVILAAMFPFGDRQGIRWACDKWCTVLRWAIGIERLDAGR